MDMILKAHQVLLWLVLMVPIASQDTMAAFDTVIPVDDFRYRYARSMEEGSRIEAGCLSVQPKGSEIVQRLYAVLPYFDKEHANAGFLHRMRGTINSMADKSDMLDREVAYFAAILTPIIFLQNYKDTWCLLERFHRAIRFYQVSHPTEKRAALKLLQNLRSVISKISMFVQNLHGPQALPFEQVTEADEVEETTRKNIRFINELIKNLA